MRRNFQSFTVELSHHSAPLRRFVPRLPVSGRKLR
jgi:hypothetical protein